MPKLKDTDYLFITAAVRARESKLLDHDRIERMLGARTAEEAEKIVEECGYGNISGLYADEMDAVLSAKLASELEDLAKLSPDKALVDVFRLQYDYHNIKTLIKAEASGAETDRLLSSAGRLPLALLREALGKKEFERLPELIGRAAKDASETLARTKDPQLADFILDKAYFSELTMLAEAAKSPFLQGYVRILIDSANLRSAIRALRMKKSPVFIKDILVPGGNVGPDRVAEASAEDAFEELYSGTPLKDAALEGIMVVSGGRLTEFERLCDNAVLGYLAGAKRVSFGEEPLIAYICALQSEVGALRVIVSGRRSDIKTEVIRERLRDIW